jgi:hypothetical protein
MVNGNSVANKGCKDLMFHMLNRYDAKKFNRSVGEGISKGEDAATHQE